MGKWLAKNGEGVHHIAFGTADVDAEAAGIRDKGVRVLYDEPRRGSMGSRITFLHPKDCHASSRNWSLRPRLSRPSTDPRT